MTKVPLINFEALVEAQYAELYLHGWKRREDSLHFSAPWTHPGHYVRDGARRQPVYCNFSRAWELHQQGHIYEQPDQT